MPDPVDLSLLATIDFEGSCFPSEGRSYPIEVAACHVGSGEAREWLIRPDPAWADWTWKDSAEAVHGISRELLQREGRPADEVLAELCAFVEGLKVVSDSDTDQHWLGVLAVAARGVATFQIESSAHLLKLLGVEGQTQQDPRWREADRIARERFPQVHRAGPDARRGAEIIRLVADWNGYLE